MTGFQIGLQTEINLNMLLSVYLSLSDFCSRGRKGSTGVTRIRSHVVAPSPRKKVETNINANNELALAA